MARDLARIFRWQRDTISDHPHVCHRAHVMMQMVLSMIYGMIAYSTVVVEGREETGLNAESLIVFCACG